ncbi:MAG TPA: glycosyltransferase family 2 protein [Candidatus Acidoferrum sp.]|nr:glycosyltransferase family 2 protein [Candidatus Acidoferrum sp.]
MSPRTDASSQTALTPLLPPVRVSIIIPIYNEILHAKALLDRVLAAPLPEGCEKEIIVIDDGSTDGTTQLLKDLSRREIIRFHQSILNFGKGTAVRIGLRIASGQIILVQDGDLEYDPNDYPRLLEPILSGQASVVYGSRFLGHPEGMQLPNLLANKILTWMANFLYGARITDEATAYKVFRRDVLNRVTLECQRFEFCPEVTAKISRLGVPIYEVPISYRGRTILEGKKIHWRDGFEAIYTLLKCRF